MINFPWHYLEVEIRYEHATKGMLWEKQFKVSLRHFLCFLFRHWNITESNEYNKNMKICRFCRLLTDYGELTEKGKKLMENHK